MKDSGVGFSNTKIISIKPSIPLSITPQSHPFLPNRLPWILLDHWNPMRFTWINGAMDLMRLEQEDRGTGWDADEGTFTMLSIEFLLC